MHVKIIYFSGTGNTKFLSEKLLQKFKEKEVNDIELIPVEDALNDIRSSECEDFVLGIGYPVYDLMPPNIILEFVNKLNNTNSTNMAFVFSTYTTDPLDSNYYIIEKLQKIGFHVAAQENFKAPGASSYFYANPKYPIVKGKTIFDTGINRKIDNFVINILNSNTQANIPIQYHRLHKLYQTISKMTFGNLFYRNLKINDNCISCGQCAKSCPTSNLLMQEGKLIIKNSNGCMRCLRCVQICNKKAINFTSSKRRGSYTRELTESAYKNAVS
jgi:ferredoxin